jgi:hypothetical protein
MTILQKSMFTALLFTADSLRIVSDDEQRTFCSKSRQEDPILPETKEVFSREARTRVWILSNVYWSPRECAIFTNGVYIVENSYSS